MTTEFATTIVCRGLIQLATIDLLEFDCRWATIMGAVRRFERHEAGQYGQIQPQRKHNGESLAGRWPTTALLKLLNHRAFLALSGPLRKEYGQVFGPI